MLLNHERGVVKSKIVNQICPQVPSLSRDLCGDLQLTVVDLTCLACSDTQAGQAPVVSSLANADASYRKLPAYEEHIVITSTFPATGSLVYRLKQLRWTPDT